MAMRDDGFGSECSSDRKLRGVMKMNSKRVSELNQIE